MSSRRNPFDEIERMFERMSRQFDRAASDLGTELDPFPGDVRVDLEDRGEAFVLTADLPGFEREEIDVRLAGDRLQIGATREEAGERSDDEGTYLRRERRRRSVSRSVGLPAPVDEDAVEAEYRNGVLTVTLPQRDDEGGTSIEVE